MVIAFSIIYNSHFKCNIPFLSLYFLPTCNVSQCNLYSQLQISCVQFLFSISKHEEKCTLKKLHFSSLNYFTMKIDISNCIKFPKYFHWLIKYILNIRCKNI